MRKHLRRYMPDHEQLREHRWFSMFGDTLLHPRLWHLNRHSAAGAVAVGLFCGLIPGPMQMFGSAILCLIFKVNLPLALVTTFYTNPLTIVPLYYVAFQLGQLVLPGNQPFVAPPQFQWDAIGAWVSAIASWMVGLGKPLALGVLMLASLLSVTGYFAVRAAWRWYLIRAWARRRTSRAARTEP